MRERLGSATKELVSARTTLSELQKAQENGPPKCFTIGCQANYEGDLWRYSSKDDYTGAGLEKPTGILKPGKFEFDKQ